MIYIDTNQLEKAADEARTAYRELNNYSSDIRSKLQSPLNGYSGQRTSNITSAESRLRQKTNLLTRSGSNFSSFATRVSNYRNEVITKETSLKHDISQLFGDFKKRYNINKTALDYMVDGLNSLLTALGLEGLGEFVRDSFYNLQAAGAFALSAIKHWYHYEGGAEAIKAVIGIALAVAAVIGAIATVVLSAGVAAIVAATVLAAIALGNAIFQCARYAEVFDSDRHVLDKNVSISMAENTSLSDGLRRLGLYEIANAIDIVDALASLVMVVDSLVSMTGTVGKEGPKLLDFMKDKKAKDGLTKLAKDGKKIAEAVKAAGGAYDMLTYRDYSGKKNLIERWGDRLNEGADLFDFLMEEGINHIIAGEENLKFEDNNGKKKVTSASGLGLFEGKFYFPEGDGSTSFLSATALNKIVKARTKTADAVGQVGKTVIRAGVTIDDFSYDEKRGEKWSKDIEIPVYRWWLPKYSYDAERGVGELKVEPLKYKLSDLSSPSKTIGKTVSSIGESVRGISQLLLGGT